MVFVKAMGDFIARGPTITVVFGCDTPSIPWDDVRRLCMGRTCAGQQPRAITTVPQAPLHHVILHCPPFVRLQTCDCVLALYSRSSLALLRRACSARPPRAARCPFTYRAMATSMQAHLCYPFAHHVAHWQQLNARL